MRLQFDTEVQYASEAAAQAARRTIYLQSANLAELESKFAAAMAALAAENLEDRDSNFAVAMIDLAGAGYGDTFIVQIETVNLEHPDVSATGVQAPQNVVMLFFGGTNENELGAASAAALQRLAALVAPGGTSTLTQTGLAGASQNARFAGAFIVTLGTAA